MSIHASIYVPPYTPPIDPWLLSLRTSLRSVFESSSLITATDDDSLNKNAGIMPLYLAVMTAFNLHRNKAIIRAMIEVVDVSEDAQLSELKAAILGVPEWETDHSDAS